MTTSTRPVAPNLDLLFRARLFIARMGEQDMLKCWATDGILGQDGAFVDLPLASQNPWDRRGSHHL